MTTPLQITESRLRDPVGERDHLRGAAHPAVTVVEYADFQCPNCGTAYANLRELLRQRAEVVQLVYRHFPISNLHPYGDAAAEAAEAAADRERFWELHDWLFEHADQLDPVHLSLAVQQFGLPVDEIDAEVKQHIHADRVRRDIVSGLRSGVDAVPAFFINDERYDGPYALPDLLAAVDAAADR